MTKEQFLEKIQVYLGAPEHNAYYDMCDILEICLETMDEVQIKKIFNLIKKKLTKKY